MTWNDKILAHYQIPYKRYCTLILKGRYRYKSLYSSKWMIYNFKQNKYLI